MHLPLPTIRNISDQICWPTLPRASRMQRGGRSFVSGRGMVQNQQFYRAIQIQLMKSPSKQAAKKDIKSSMSLLLQQDAPLDLPPALPSPAPILLDRQLIQNALEISAWRVKTSLPIIKPLYCLLHPAPHPPSALTWHTYLGHPPRNMPSEQIDWNQAAQRVTEEPEVENYELWTETEEIRWRLSQMGKLGLSQNLYLLKQMMIGYDVLMDIFGTFDPSPSMVAVNGSDQWRVWIHENYDCLNKHDPPQQIGEKEFIYRLLLIAEQHCQVTTLSKTFFSNVKEFTYSNDCTFIRMLEKIKDFMTTNKIFPVNKLSLPIERTQKEGKEGDSFNKRSEVFKQMGGHQPAEKKYFLQPTHKQQAGFGPSQNKSMTNLNNANYKRSQFVPHPTPAFPNNSHLHNPKRINSSYFFPTNSTPTSPTNFNCPLAFPRSNLQQRQGYSSQFLMPPNLTSHSQFTNIFNQPKEHVNPPFDKARRQQKVTNNGFKSSINAPPRLDLSPPKSKNERSLPKSNKPLQQPKLLISQPFVPLPPQPIAKARKGERKYSQQLFKVKSLQVLIGKERKICGSNIYDNDPEIRLNGVNVIKRAPERHIPEPTEPVAPKLLQSSDLKCVSSPNNSSSTKQLQNSAQTDKLNRVPEYKNLKNNDLNSGKFRNNQSSYLGVAGMANPNEDRRDKNLAVSYEFRNRNEHKSCSPEEVEDNKECGNNWTKKLSGLFSDDASIKHLKGSVNFKTKEERLFEKQYLKDVKLDMLEKFGRPVRHSIVDEEDGDETPREEGNYNRNEQYRSMQLIEEVFDDQAKSYIEKEEKQEEEEPIRIRGRNQTVQMMNAKKEEQFPKHIERKECLSEYYSSHGSESERQDEHDEMAAVIY